MPHVIYGRRSRVRFTVWGALAVCLLLSASNMAGGAAADWSGDADIGPTSVTGGKFQCTVDLTNGGTADLHVTEVVYSIVWPFDPIMEGQNRWIEKVTIFQGEQVITSGGSHLFVGQVSADGSGGFRSEVLVTAYAEGEPPSVRVFTGDIAMAESAPADPVPLMAGILVASLAFMGMIIYYYVKNDIPLHMPLLWARPHARIKVVRNCPSCEREIPNDSKLCPYCGRKL